MEQKEYNGSRYFNIDMPEAISRVNGIRVFGRILRSFIFTTDIALLMNNNADAVMGVYPFTSLSVVNHSLINASPVPVFCGIGGMNVPEEKLLDVAKEAEHSGAYGVVANSYVKSEMISKLKKALDIPVVVTVVSVRDDIERKLDSGADMFNISGAGETCAIIEKVKKKFHYVPIIATGGPSDETIIQTIEYGADAISFTPPSNAEIFKKQMSIFRDKL